MTRLFGCLWVCCLLLSLSASGVYAAEYDVNQDGTGDFTAIQAAIDAAVDGDVIVVHPGTYYENIQFDGKNMTLRSLDPEDEQIVASTVIDGGQKGSVVTFDGTEDETCLISGFTITNGWTHYDGGGVWGGGTWPGPGAHARISNCTITGNSAMYGGGGLAYCDGTITNCTISANSATGEDAHGGGLYYCAGPITDCTITGNSATDEGEFAKGGGLYSCHGPISNCTISSNVTSALGGGLCFCWGTISNCTISSNTADNVGGGLFYCWGTISNCTITGNSATGFVSSGGGLHSCDGTITNCTISGNSATGAVALGAGLRACHGTISNCTITGNSAACRGGGLYECDGTITNCIIWGNQADREGNELYYYEDPVITYSCIRGWTGGGDGNISDDPLFVSGPLGDYYLSCRAAGQDADSPCIDAGSGTAESLGLDKFTTRTDGVPDADIVDMGCHYPLTLDQNPYIECSLNASEFAPGDALVGFIEAHNPGPDVAVDAYVAFVLPDGAIVSLTSGGLAIGTHPWVSNVVLPSGFDFGPTEVLWTTVPQSPGDHLFAAALTIPGQFDFIGQPSLFPFTISE